MKYFVFTALFGALLAVSAAPANAALFDKSLQVKAEKQLSGFEQIRAKAKFRFSNAK